MVNPKIARADESEAATIGAVLLSDSPLVAFAKVSGVVDSEDFSPVNGFVWKAIQELARNGVPADMTTLETQLRSKGAFDNVGGSAYLHQLIESVGSAVNIDHYAQQVASASLRRNVARIADEAEDISSDLTLSPKEQADKLAEAVRKLTLKGGESDFRTAAEVVQEIMASAISVESDGNLSTEQFTCATISTGLPWLDSEIGGFPLPSLSLIAARSGIGKSAAVTAASINLLRAGKSIALFSFEMSRRQYIERFVCAISGVNSRKVSQGLLSNSDYDQVVGAMDEITHWGKRLKIYDSSAPKPERMLSLIESSVADGADYVFVDHVGLVGDPTKGRYEAQSAVADVCLAAKQRCQVPIIALIQFNRLNDREARPPRLSDLRDSGKWEENADMVIAIHRPAQQERRDNREIDKWLNDNVTQPEPVQWAIVKNRFGETKTVESEFYRPLAQFREGKGNNWLRVKCGMEGE